METVTVVRGRVQVGCADDERELGEGESLRYRGDLPHRFASLGTSADVVLLVHYPRKPVERRPRMTDDRQLPARSQIVQWHLTDAGLTAAVRELPDPPAPPPRRPRP
jgi:hypothetical protein